MMNEPTASPEPARTKRGVATHAVRLATWRRQRAIAEMLADVPDDPNEPEGDEPGPLSPIW